MTRTPMLECVVNVSEGHDGAILSDMTTACGSSLLDVHSDEFHNRTVFTLAGESVERDVRNLAGKAIDRVDLSTHRGVHPRIGAVDVVPFVPLVETGATFEMAIAARNSFGEWVANTHEIPCFFYGPERSLPYIRKHAFDDLSPDTGPARANARSGACAVGARGYLIAYNLWLDNVEFKHALAVAKSIRSANLRTLALLVGKQVQISCNLVKPVGEDAIGPAEAYDAIARHVQIERAELVGLLPAAALDTIAQNRWTQLDVGPDKTIEARLTK